MAAYQQIDKGATSQSVILRIVDSTDGTPETGVVFNTSGIDLWYRRDGAAKTSITEATLSALTDAWSSGGFLHIGDGYYRLDVPDAAFATGVSKVAVGGAVTGMVVIGAVVDLCNPINVASGIIEANVKQVNGTSQTARDLGASVLLSSGTGTGQLDITSGVVKSNLVQILATALTETAGQIAAAFKQFFDVASPTGTMKALTNVVTATNLTNAPTSGDLTATMKTSVTTAATAATPVAASVTGNVGGSVASVTAAVATTSNIKKNQALASFMFVMRDSTNHAPVTGKTVSVFISKDGGSFTATTTATATEVANGWYKISFTQTEMNANVIAIRATATTSDDFTMTVLTVP